MRFIVLAMIFTLSMSLVFAADIELTAPLGGDDDGSSREYYGGTLGTTVDIEWETALSCGAGSDAVIIEFSDDDGTTWSILTSTASVSDLTYGWDVSSLTDGSGYMTRLSSSCNVPDEISGSFSLDTTAPIADLANLTIDEGDDLTLDATASDDATSPLVSFTYTINSVEYLSGAVSTDTLDLTWEDLADYSITNDGTYTIEVEVEDASGNTHSDSATLTVENSEATVEITYPNGAEEVTSFIDVTAEVSDPVDTSFTCEYFIVENASTSPVETSLGSQSCTTGTDTFSFDSSAYTDSTDIEIKVEVDDGTDVTQDYSDASFTIDNTAPTLSIDLLSSIYESDEATLVFHPSDNVSGFDNSDSFEIDWDDGTVETTDSETLTHSYIEDGTYTIEVTVTDDVGLSVTDTLLLTVINVAPVIDSLTCTATILEGESIDLDIEFSDVGVEDTHELGIDWDDLSTTNITVPTSSYEMNSTHTYDQDGTYVIEATVTDDDGGSSTVSYCTVIVTNVAPTVEITSHTDGEYLTGTQSIEWDVFDVGISDAVEMEVFYALATATTSCGDASEWTSIDYYIATSPVDGSFSYSWDTTTVSDGDYDLCVFVEDHADSSDDTISITIDSTIPEVYGPEVSYDHFQSDSYVYFTASASDIDGGIVSAVVEIYDEDGDLVSSTAMDASDDTFEDDDFEGLESWILIDSSSYLDGVYTYIIWVTDLAGNENDEDDLVVGTFIVDASAGTPSYTDDEIDALLAVLEDDITSLETDLTTLDSELDDLSDLVDTNSDDITSLESNLSDLSDEVDTLSDSISDLETEDASLQSQIDDLTSDLTSLESDLTSLESDLSDLETEFDAYTSFTISQTSDTSDSDGDFSVTVSTTSSAACTIADVFDSSVTTTTSAATSHTLTVSDADLGMQIYSVTCTDSTYGFSKETTAYVNVVGFYNLFIADGGNDGFLARIQRFVLSYAELIEAGLSSYDVDTVLTSTDGPSDMQLNATEDVDMLWAYNGTTWSSYNVSNSTGDFGGFDATDVPVYYWVTLEDSAAGKAIIHQDGKNKR